MVAIATVFSWNAGTDAAPVLAAVPAGPPNVRFKDADENDVSTTNPVTIEAAVKFNFWKSIALRFTGTYTQVDNIRHHTDGTIAWGLGTTGEARRGNRVTGDHGITTANYRIADGKNDIDAAPPAGHEFYEAQATPTALLTGDTAGAPATIDTTVYTAPPDDSKAVVMQVKVDTDATPGNKDDETFTWLYDEI